MIETRRLKNVIFLQTISLINVTKSAGNVFSHFCEVMLTFEITDTKRLSEYLFDDCLDIFILL